MVGHQLLSDTLRRGAAALAVLLLPITGARAAELTLDEALVLGDCARAAALDASANTVGQRIGVARCLTALGRPMDAASRFAGLRGGDIDGYVRLLEAEARLASHDAAGALERLAGVSLPAPASERLALARGRAHLEAGQLEQARETLRPLLEGSLGAAGHSADPWGADPAEVRWLLAEGAVKRGEPERAIPVWQAIWARNPTSPRALQAATRLAAAGSSVPDPSTADGRALMLERVRTLDKLFLYKESLALRDQLADQGVRTLARAAFNAKDYARAASLWSTIPDLGAQDSFDLALATTRAGDYTAAEQHYRNVVRTWPATGTADFASYKIGYLAYDAGQLERAVGLLREHLSRYPSSAHEDEARWFIAWSLVRLERKAEAERALDELLAAAPGSSLSAGARYWKARLRDQAGDSTGARQVYEAVLSSYPTTGYAWFSADRLNRSWTSRPLPSAPTVPAALQTSAYKRGATLLEAGLDGWARAELGTLTGAARAAGKDARLALALLLVRAGDYNGARGLAEGLCGTPWKGDVDLVAAQACWPRPQGALLDRITRDGGLDRLLPYAIMNAESALRPTVTSPVGARGLMQLMPEVGGRAHAIRFPGRSYSVDDLYLPAYNAALGTTELVALRQRLASARTSPQLPLVIAAYNGGPEAVERWIPADPRNAEADWFSENIGYTETRQYVRRVLGFLQTWRYVYGDG